MARSSLGRLKFLGIDNFMPEMVIGLVDLMTASMTFQDTYSSTKSYKKNNVVSSGTDVYIVLQDTTAGVPVTDTTSFLKLSGEDGNNGNDGNDGQPGAAGSGYSGVTTSKVGGSQTVTFTPLNGAAQASFVVQDGEDGQPGNDGSDGRNGTNGTNGNDGNDGQPGADGSGYSGVSTSKVGRNQTVTFTPLNGAAPASVVVQDGADGNDGRNGEDGQPGGQGGQGEQGEQGEDGPGYSGVSQSTTGTVTTITFNPLNGAQAASATIDVSGAEAELQELILWRRTADDLTEENLTGAFTNARSGNPFPSVSYFSSVPVRSSIETLLRRYLVVAYTGSLQGVYISILSSSETASAAPSGGVANRLFPSVIMTVGDYKVVLIDLEDEIAALATGDRVGVVVN